MDHAHRVGDFRVTALYDGPLAFNLDKVFDPVERAQATELVAGASPELNVYAFLLETAGHRFLIDTGAGRLMTRDLGQTVRVLRNMGVEPDTIDHIFLTHIHIDHAGGLVDEDGRAAFPRASLFVHEQEAGFWMDTPPEQLANRARWNAENVVPGLRLYPTLRVGDAEAPFGLRPILAAGHTPGHTCWMLESRGEQLLAWGDVIHLPEIHLPSPHIRMSYDLDAAEALRSRARMLAFCADSGIKVAGAHLPSPGIGRIRRDGLGYRFESETPPAGP